MSEPSKPFVSEKTFKAYTKDQGDKYAQARPGYHPNLYKTILDHHTSTGGTLDTILDIGCGPGLAVRALAPKFNHAIGLDPSDGMITSARALGGTTASSEPIRFAVSSAEDLGSHLDPKIEDASVDLITASTAAHWFDMTRFWPAAKRVLKPGGTVAFWGTGSIHIHSSVPNAAAIQAAFDDMEENELMPYFTPGNLIAKNLYRDMPLPWTLEPKLEEFEKETFFRKLWQNGTEEDFYEQGRMEVNLDMMEMVQATISPVQRWREAHPEKVGTDEDVVKVVRRKIEKLLHEAGVEKGKELLRGSSDAVLIMVKKTA